MSENRQRWSENEILFRLVVLVFAILAVTWIFNDHQAKPATTTPAKPVTSGPSDLKVVSGSGNSSTAVTANPQQTGTTQGGSTDPVQSAPSSLQPAQTSSDMSDALKQELGL